MSPRPYLGRPPEEVASQRRASRMEKVDQFDPAIRALIHEYGLATVQALMDCGVTKPKQIKHIVETILDEFSPTRGTYSGQGHRVEVDGGPGSG